MSADGLEIVHKLRAVMAELPTHPYEMHSAGEFLRKNAVELERLLLIGVLALQRDGQHWSIEALVTDADAKRNEWPSIGVA